MNRPIVVLTDRAWPDDRIEREVLQAAGIELVDASQSPTSAASIHDVIARHQPRGVLTCWAPVSASSIGASGALQVITRMGVGLDNIDVEAATARGVLVTNVPDYCVPEVSDHAVAMVLAWTRGLVIADRAVHAGHWNPAGARLRRLASLTCGIVGHGRIGAATAAKLSVFGCRVLLNDPHPQSTPVGEHVDLPTLLRFSDVVVLHAPLTKATHHLIGPAQLALMRPGGLLVNVSRGGLVDTDAVVEALASGQLSGAALDVLESEPGVPPGLLAASGAILTPHVAFSSDASVAELRRSAAEDVAAVLSGRPPRHARNCPVSN